VESQGSKLTGGTTTETKPNTGAEVAKADDLVTSNAPAATTNFDDKKEETASKEPQTAPTDGAAAAKADGALTTTDAPATAGEIAPTEDASTTTGALGDTPAAAPGSSDVAAAPAADKPTASTNGADTDAKMTDAPAPEEAALPVVGEKRKAEEDPVPANGDVKKVKADDANGSEATVDTNGKSEPPKKAGRGGKKDKKPLEKAKEVVGRTLRKTRSQGPIDQ
jgi:hypothetical protein